MKANAQNIMHIYYLLRFQSIVIQNDTALKLSVNDTFYWIVERLRIRIRLGVNEAFNEAGMNIYKFLLRPMFLRFCL